MLSFEVHRLLVSLISKVHDLTEVAAEPDRIAPSEVELRVQDTRRLVHQLEDIVGVEFGQLRRHLNWMVYWHRRGEPSSSDPDIRSLRGPDLQAVIDAVEEWSSEILDSDLGETINKSWKAESYDAAVREAFIFLETRMREVAAVDPVSGITGRSLVSRLLPGNGQSDRWTASGFLGELTEREQVGGRDLLNGAVSLPRNATAHRATGYSRAEAEDIIHLVNLCLRLVAKVSPAASSESGEAA